MRPFLAFLFLSLHAFSLDAQSEPVTAVGENLEKIIYPFPVQYIELSVQQQTLKMAYGCVAGTAERQNGRIAARQEFQWRLLGTNGNRSVESWLPRYHSRPGRIRKIVQTQKPAIQFPAACCQYEQPA